MTLINRWRRWWLGMVMCGIGLAAQAGAFEDFFAAIEVDNARGVRSLLERGFDANAVDEKGQHPLYLALRGEAFKVAEVLLAHPGTKVDSTNAAGETPLMMAALRGHTEWAKRLLDRGAAVHKPDWSPMHYAATGPSVAVVRLLHERGAPIEAHSPNRTTPLMMAAQYGSEEAVDYLLARGADARAKNDRGLDAAAFARLGGREALALRLAR
jgi:uncharacterized protein